MSASDSNVTNKLEGLFESFKANQREISSLEEEIQKKERTNSKLQRSLSFIQGRILQKEEKMHLFRAVSHNHRDNISPYNFATIIKTNKLSSQTFWTPKALNNLKEHQRSITAQVEKEREQQYAVYAEVASNEGPKKYL